MISKTDALGPFIKTLLDDYDQCRLKELDLADPRCVLQEFARFHHELLQALVATPVPLRSLTLRAGTTVLAGICLRSYQCLPSQPDEPEKGGPADVRPG